MRAISKRGRADLVGLRYILVDLMAAMPASAAGAPEVGRLAGQTVIKAGLSAVSGASDTEFVSATRQISESLRRRLKRD